MADYNIAMGFKPLELQNPMVGATQIAQLENAGNQNALAQLKMQEARDTNAERNALRQLNPASADYENQLFKLNPTLGIAYRKEQAATASSNATRDKALVEAAGEKRKQLGQAYRDISANPSQAQITAHLEDIMGSSLYSDAEKASITKRSEFLLGMPFEERQMYLAQQGASAGELKPSTVQINRGGATDVLRVPAFGGAPSTAGSYADVPFPADVQAQKMLTARAAAPKTEINVSTEKKYGEMFAGKMAETDISKLTTAEKTPQLAESANRIIDLVNSGKIISGPAADVKLAIARAMNVTGANNAELISNTERLISAQGQATLDAIKGAGLGTGQGFTDKDLRFLQGIAGGTINLTPETMREMANLQHRVAQRSADAWNSRVKQIPASATQGTGLSTEPIKVPELRGAGPKRPAGVGADWSIMTDANGNKAYVSPDRKQFKEVP